VLFGRDAQNPASRDVAPPDLAGTPRPSHVLHIVGPFQARVQPASAQAVEHAVASLRRAGITVTRIELPPDFDHIEWITYTLLCRGIARHHGADFDRASGSMSARMRELVERGRGIGDAEHTKALAMAGEFTHQLSSMLPPGTVAVNAAVDDVAPLRTEGTGVPILQALWTVAGLPALAVPCGRAAGLPIGVQLAAGPGQEALLFGTARGLLKAASPRDSAPTRNRRPPRHCPKAAPG
jgi:Asp-tRNA(Asn)/Glu-tRNA(Gln) amidotransferase A subunit family amidase